MFTGIIESIGKVSKLEKEDENLHLTIAADFISELQIDQSISHNGVCLTVVGLTEQTYTVTAIKETLKLTNIGKLIVGDLVNLERSMQPQSRIDGHFVQGHVDRTATCISVEEVGGSWYYHFQFEPDGVNILVDKGSICINGVSLTVVKAQNDSFSVAIIPYTYEQTNFKTIEVGTVVNLEFDVIGKYVAKLFERYTQNDLKPTKI